MDYIKSLAKSVPGFSFEISEDEYIQFLASITPVDCNFFFRDKVFEVQRAFLREIYPDLLYFSPETDIIPARVFVGHYLMDPRIVVPSSHQVKEHYEWIQKQTKSFKGKHPFLKGVDDLYERYLRMALNNFVIYISDFENQAVYGSEGFDSIEDSPVFLLEILVRTKRELGKLNAIISNYKSRSAPEWMCNHIFREAKRKHEIIRLLEKIV